jgi:hypothetical protein
MRRHAHYSIAALRKWRRAISLAVLPTFASWSLSAAACFGMPLQVANDEMTVDAHVDHDMSSSHSSHGTPSQMHEHSGMPDCAHCPPATDDSQAPSTICVADGTSNATAPKASAAPDLLQLFTQSRAPALSWVAAPPPLILSAVVTDAPHVEHTPLNVRHCVFLI